MERNGSLSNIGDLEGMSPPTKPRRLESIKRCITPKLMDSLRNIKPFPQEEVKRSRVKRKCIIESEKKEEPIKINIIKPEPMNITEEKMISIKLDKELSLIRSQTYTPKSFNDSGSDENDFLVNSVKVKELKKSSTCSNSNTKEESDISKTRDVEALINHFRKTILEKSESEEIGKEEEKYYNQHKFIGDKNVPHVYYYKEDDKGFEIWF